MFIKFYNRKVEYLFLINEEKEKETSLHAAFPFRQRAGGPVFSQEQSLPSVG